VIFAQAGARPGGLPDGVVAGLDCDVVGAIPVVGVRKMRRTVHLKVKEARIVGGNKILAHLDGPGYGYRDLQCLLRVALGRRVRKCRERRPA